LPPSPPVPPRGSTWTAPRQRIIVAGYVRPYPNLHVFHPFGVFEPRHSIQIFAPLTVVPPVPRFLEPEVDLSGVDLDVERPPWAKDRAPDRPRLGVPPVVKPAPPEIAKRIEPPKKEPPPPEPPKPPLPLEPKANPVEEAQRLVTLGTAAFQAGDYGLAAQRFQQALDADAAAPRPHFLLGQALVALGKFSAAVQTIGLGLAKDPAWPKNAFRPRLDLYRNQPEEWVRHLMLLEEAHERQPQNAGFLFMVAYLRWFDDDRATALRLFRQVRPLVADPALVDLFLKEGA
jgi:tetratricopeptide (TPR) repeat protein